MKIEIIKIALEEAKKFLLRLKESNKGYFLAVRYRREYPKCKNCGKRFEKETKLKRCIYCNGEIEYETTDIIRFGVKNPGEGITKPGTGIRKGKDFFQALEEDNCIKYYSFMRKVDRTDGKKGGYRQFKLENLIDFTIGKKRYVIKEN